MIGPFQSLFLYRFIWNSFLFGNMQVFMLDSAQTVCLRFRNRPSLLSQLDDSNMFFVLLIKQRNVYRRAYFGRPIALPLPKASSSFEKYSHTILYCLEMRHSMI